MPPWKTPEIIAHTTLLLDSYEQLLGKCLLPRSGDEAQSLYLATFPVVSHGIEIDPIFNYGNQCALDLWQLTWEELTRTPSRATVAGDELGEEERERMLAKVRSQGYIDYYQGVRVTGKGQRFRIDRAVVWNLTDRNGRYRGQAATFSHWEFL
ncbi:MAG: hypothetical protein N5P05_003049 [Chroococcopsis gigantea SAG 12.99]|jgi:hypothetical protein|nr:MEKHLA domain-containing protein [Chlorogloea purpurea SAG 13.99]MDV3001443.1 hypothetical protein [Chroococcopsis gigantea SAG 12.99]